MDQLSTKTGLCPHTIIDWIKLLRGNVTPGAKSFGPNVERFIYVEKWLKHGHVPVAYWKWGYRELDAPRPKPMTVADYNRRALIRRKMKAQTAAKTALLERLQRSDKSG